MTDPYGTGALIGQRVRLEPISPTHLEALVAAAGEDRESFNYTAVPNGREAMTAYIEDLVKARTCGQAVGYAQIETTTGVAVGSTRFLELRSRPGERRPYAVEIGGTWLATSAQRTGINREAKLLLLTQAFDGWEVGRVDFRTDVRNVRSRNAIAALGATFEGVLRNCQPSRVAGEEHELRDSAIYSITDAEWPAVRRRLARGIRRSGSTTTE